MNLKKGDLLVSNGSQLAKGVTVKVIDILPEDYVVESVNCSRYIYAKHSIFEYFDKEEIEAPKHYDNSKGSLYLFAEQHNLNAWEFDAIKRIVRSRKKGNFIED